MRLAQPATLPVMDGRVNYLEAAAQGRRLCIGLGSSLSFSISRLHSDFILTIILFCRLDGLLAKQTIGAGNKLNKASMAICTSELHGEFLCVLVVNHFSLNWSIDRFSL